MRPLALGSLLGAALLGILIIPSDAQAQRRRGRVSYSPPVVGYYYAPPAYYYPSRYYYQPRYYYPPPAYYSAPSYYYPSTSAYSPGDESYSSSRYDRAAPVMKVGAYDTYFKPSSLTVAAGTTVQWTNYGEHKHTVTAADGSWESGELLPMASAAPFLVREPTTFTARSMHEK